MLIFQIHYLSKLLLNICITFHANIKYLPLHVSLHLGIAVKSCYFRFIVTYVSLNIIVFKNLNINQT